MVYANHHVDKVGIGLIDINHFTLAGGVASKMGSEG